MLSLRIPRRLRSVPFLVASALAVALPLGAFADVEVAPPFVSLTDYDTGKRYVYGLGSATLYNNGERPVIVKVSIVDEFEGRFRIVRANNENQAQNETENSCYGDTDREFRLARGLPGRASSQNGVHLR